MSRRTEARLRRELDHAREELRQLRAQLALVTKACRWCGCVVSRKHQCPTLSSRVPSQFTPEIEWRLTRDGGAAVVVKLCGATYGMEADRLAPRTVAPAATEKRDALIEYTIARAADHVEAETGADVLGRWRALVLRLLNLACGGAPQSEHASDAIRESEVRLMYELRCAAMRRP